MTCRTTHHACECVLRRMALLEAVAKAARASSEYTGGGVSVWDDLREALAALDAEGDGT